jgi:hypothetical protein
MNNKFERSFKDTVGAYLRYCFEICPVGLNKITESYSLGNLFYGHLV